MLRSLSALLMISAAGVVALVAIAYSHAMEYVTELMIRLSTQHPYVFLGLSPLCFLLAAFLVRRFSPDAGGSGIPQVLAKIDILDKTEAPPAGFRHNLKLILVKIASSCLIVLGGGLTGREGPTIQISASIFEMFDRLFRKHVSTFRSRQTLLIAGGGAGLAAAFNTPLGGIIFAIEELASEHFKSFKIPLILSVVVAGYVTQAVTGSYLFIGHPRIIELTWIQNGVALGGAIIIGAIGALFARILFRWTVATRSWRLSRRYALTGVVAFVVALVCLYLGPDASAGGIKLIRKLLFTETGWQEMNPLIAVWRTLGVVVTYVAGGAGGFFAPALSAGAALGAQFAKLASFQQPGLMIVIGMIAFLTGATRAPFTSFILVFEMTDRQAAVVPMMASALLAYAAAQFVEKEGFYEKMKGVFVREQEGRLEPEGSIDERKHQL